jgi:uncharacterized phosphatase
MFWRMHPSLAIIITASLKLGGLISAEWGAKAFPKASAEVSRRLRIHAGMAMASGSDLSEEGCRPLIRRAVLISLYLDLLRRSMAFFYFIRHGETEWNAAGRLCGRTDVALSEAGRRQARLLAARLQPVPFAALYSSPARRALETASILGQAIGLEAVSDSRLVELSYGGWEGKTYEESKRANPEIYRAWELDPASVAPPEGESGKQLIERLKPFVAEVAQRHPTGNIVVVCHRTLCRLLGCHIMGLPLSEYRKRIPMENAALNIFETRNGKGDVVALNDPSPLVDPAVEIISQIQP